jgi:hypothetical protein
MNIFEVMNHTNLHYHLNKTDSNYQTLLLIYTLRYLNFTTCSLMFLTLIADDQNDA